MLRCGARIWSDELPSPSHALQGPGHHKFGQRFVHAGAAFDKPFSLLCVCVCCLAVGGQCDATMWIPNGFALGLRGCLKVNERQDLKPDRLGLFLGPGGRALTFAAIPFVNPTFLESVGGGDRTIFGLPSFVRASRGVVG